MQKRLIQILVVLIVLCLAVLGFKALSNETPKEEALPPGVIREDNLDIQTDNPQPAGRNVQPTN